jgi:hypothetical protein
VKKSFSALLADTDSFNNRSCRCNWVHLANDFPCMVPAMFPMSSIASSHYPAPVFHSNHQSVFVKIYPPNDKAPMELPQE